MFEAVARRRLSHGIVGQIAAAIRGGHYPPGAALPSERELMGAFGVGRPAVREALRRLPGRRLVFTNGSAGHARRVLDHLRLADLFDDVFHLEAMGLVPKPNAQAFERLIAAHAVEPATTAFFEDTPANLAPAAALGMTTVLVGRQASAEGHGFVDHRAPALVPFLERARLATPGP